MNKRKRMAGIKHRLRRIRYEAKRKVLLANGTSSYPKSVHKKHPKTIDTPLTEAVAAAVVAPTSVAKAETATTAKKLRSNKVVDKSDAKVSKSIGKVKSDTQITEVISSDDSVGDKATALKKKPVKAKSSAKISSKSKKADGTIQEATVKTGDSKKSKNAKKIKSDDNA